jgi:hypothetical protein
MFLASYRDASADSRPAFMLIEFSFLIDFILQFFLTYSKSGSSYQKRRDIEKNQS